jgi:hypothetical protein
MAPRRFAFMILVMVFGAAAPAMALTVDVCVNPAVDVRADSTGVFFAATAPIYPAGTIAPTSSPFNCATITAAPIGTFFATGASVAGLPASGPNDADFVTWHFRLGSMAFDTIGPVESLSPYPQTIVGSTGGTARNGTAQVTALDSTGFAFEVTVPGARQSH